MTIEPKPGLNPKDGLAVKKAGTRTGGGENSPRRMLIGPSGRLHCRKQFKREVLQESVYRNSKGNRRDHR